MMTLPAPSSLISSHYLLALSVANRYASRHRLDPDSVISDAMLCLVRCVPNHDPSLGTFAAYVTSSIHRYLLDSECRDPVIHLPNRYRGGGRRRVEADATRARTVGSIDPAAGRDCPDGRDCDPSSAAMLADELARMGAAIGRLNPREREVIARRNGLGGGEPQTYAEIGAAMGISTPWAWRVEERAMGKLGAMLGVKGVAG